MDLGQIYMSSPDWIKGLMVVLPFLTFYATIRLFRAGRGGEKDLGHVASKVRHLPVTPPRSAELPLLQNGRVCNPAELDVSKQIEGWSME